MIGILADTRADTRLLQRAVGGVARVFHTAGELTATELDIECLVLSSRSRLLSERIPLLREIERKLPWVPVILVTDREIAIAPVLSRVQVADLVWFEDVQRRLATRIESARGASALVQLAERVRRSTAPAALRSALVHSLIETRRVPIHNVQQLAAAVGYSPVTLFQQFRARARGRTTLSRFLGALAILRAQELRRTERTWKNVSARLGLPRASLGRKSKRWPGCTLSQLERIAPQQLLAAFVSEHLNPLLDSPRSAREDPIGVEDALPPASP